MQGSRYDKMPETYENERFDNFNWDCSFLKNIFFVSQIQK